MNISSFMTSSSNMSFNYLGSKSNHIGKDIIPKIISSFIIVFSVFSLASSLVFPLVNMYESINMCGTLIAFFITLVIFISLSRTSQVISSNLLKITMLTIVLLVSICQIIVVFNMQLVPNVDLSHIYEQALTMIDNDSIIINNSSYFGIYPNNIPVTILIYWVFRFTKFLGFTNYRVAGGLFNITCIWISWFFLYRIAVHIFNKKCAYILLGFIAINPLFIAYASYYYTDTTSLPFLCGAAYCLLTDSLVDDNSQNNKIFKHMLGGGLLCVAMLIRITSIFLGLAILVYLIIYQRIYRNRYCLIAVITGFFVSRLLFSFVYQMQVPFDTRETSMPATHFLMMASSGYGNYNAEDVEFTLSYPTHEEKVENNLRMYEKRLKENGVLGNIKLILFKEAQVWGIGPHGFPQYTEYVTRKNIVYELIRGKKSGEFFCYTQGYNAAFFLMLLIATITNRHNYSNTLFIISIYLVGAVVFYIFWEAHPRHAFCIMTMSSFLLIPSYLFTNNTQ